MVDTLRPGQRVVVTELGETPLDGLDRCTRIEEMPPPDPQSLRPTDVIISIASASVGWVDLLMLSGQYQHLAPPPYTPGLEYSGVVAWTGAEVDPVRVKVGDAVMVDPFYVGPRSSGDYRTYGGFAAYGVAPAHAVLPVPKGFSFDEACNFIGNYETAYHCLVACGDLQSGETVLIHGASGSTGLAAVQIAKRLGAVVIATGRSDSKLAFVKAQGADHVINCRAEASDAAGAAGWVRRFRDEVKALTGGEGVHVVYDAVGGDISLESLRCVRFGARFLIVGWAGTPFVAAGKGQRGAPNVNTLPTNLIMMKGLKVLGCPTVIATQHDPSIRPPRVAALKRWTDEGHLRPHISHRFPLTEYRAAMRAKWQGEVAGGCVLHPAALDGH